jgi:hypothetical protein
VDYAFAAERLGQLLGIDVLCPATMMALHVEFDLMSP